MIRYRWHTGTRVILAVLAALCTVVGLTVSGLPAHAAAPTTTTPTPTPGTVDEQTPAAGVRVELTDISPTVLVPEDDLVLTGVVHNDSPTAVSDLRLHLRIQQHTPISRSAVERWLADTRPAGRAMGMFEVAEEVAAGDSQNFRVRVPAEDLQLSRGAMAWGPRGIELSAWDGTQRLLDQTAARNFLLWWPDMTVEPMPVAVLGTLVPTAAERREAARRNIAVGAVAEPRLQPVLTALDRADTDLAIDPSLLAEPTDLGLVTGETTTPATTDDDNRAASLRDAIGSYARAADRYLHALPWADTDAAALAHAGYEHWWPAALERGREELSRHELTTVPSVSLAGAGRVSHRLAWPVGDSPDVETLTALQAAGTEAVVLPQTALAPVDMLTYTPAGRATVALSHGRLDVLLFDEQLSQLLAGTHRRFDPALPEATIDALTARQLLLAQTAVIVRERPAMPRGQLLAVPRDFAGDPEVLATALDALEDAPWLERVAVSQLLTAPGPDLPRQPLPQQVVSAGEAGARLLGQGEETLARTEDFASMLPDPDGLVSAVHTDVLTLASHAWRSDAAQRQQEMAELLAQAQARHELVAAQSGSTLNLINNEAHIPVSVTNGLRDAVTLTVELRPRDPRLVAEDAVDVTIGAQESTMVHIPVHAVGSGNVDVDVVLYSPSGAVVGTGGDMQVRVRADWETVGTAVVAGVLVVLLIIGLIRTARRGRRMPPERA